MRSLAWTDKKKKDRKPYRVSRRALRGLREKEFLLCWGDANKAKTCSLGPLWSRAKPCTAWCTGRSGRETPLLFSKKRNNLKLIYIHQAFISQFQFRNNRERKKREYHKRVREFTSEGFRRAKETLHLLVNLAN